MPKAKKIYLGDQLAWPTKKYLTWYRDFTTTSQADLIARWWSGQWWGSRSVSSSWLTTSRSTTDRSYVVSLPITISNQAKSIRIYWVVNRRTGSWYGNMNRWIKATNYCGTWNTDWVVWDDLISQSVVSNNNSWYMWFGAWSGALGFDPGISRNENIGYSDSDITVEALIDIENWTMTASRKSWDTVIKSWTGTFDAAAIKATLSSLSTSQYLYIYNRNWTWNYKYVKNLGYEIIY